MFLKLCVKNCHLVKSFLVNFHTTTVVPKNTQIFVCTQGAQTLIILVLHASIKNAQKFTLILNP